MKWIRNILLLIVVVYLIFFIGFHFKQQLTAIKASLIATKLLDNTVSGNYAAAFKNIYYYNGPYDYNRTIEFDDAKHIWIDRLKAMKDKGIYLSSYSNLRTSFNDGSVYGSVDLIFYEQGKESKYHTLINFHLGKEGIRIATLQSFDADGSNEVEWEKNLSGFIPKS